MRGHPGRRVGRRLVPTLLDRLLEAESQLRHRRRRLGIAVLIAVMIGAVACADAYVWPGISLAFGYAVPVTLGAYVFGVRRGVELSLLCVILRRVCAGRAYGPWWLYAGSVLMLAEYSMLALAGGLLGRAARRLARHTRVLQRLSEAARGLTVNLEPEAIWRQAVEAAVHLTGADGGLVATAQGDDWHVTAVFCQDRWESESFVWWPSSLGTWGARGGAGHPPYGTAPNETPPLRRRGAEVQLAVALAGPEPGERHALVVFRAESRLFERPTCEVLQLLALHVGAALHTAALYQAAVQGTAKKGRLLAHLAHELAVPHHVVLGSMDMLAAHVDETGRSCLERLRRQERLLLEMTSNLLEYARLEGGQRAVRRTRVDVPELFRHVEELAEPLIGDKDVCLEVRVEQGAESVESDPGGLRRIVANLVVNAVKYTPAGQIELHAGRENGGVRLAVRDTGPGITPAEQQRIFEPYYRGVTATRGAEAGVGLGLALARDLARWLGTELVVESREGEGTTFSLLLPAGPAADERRPQHRGERGGR